MISPTACFHVNGFDSSMCFLLASMIQKKQVRYVGKDVVQQNSFVPVYLDWQLSLLVKMFLEFFG
jgi:hypothetical protein